jgi:hypothetical protein
MADDGRGRSAQAQASTTVAGPDPTPDGGVVPEPDAGPDVPPDGPVIPQPNGAGCFSAPGCTSGNCVDGICCDSPCLGLCTTCNRAGQAGVCGLVDNGQDPRDDCPSSGACNGQGTCAPLAVRPGSELVLSGSLELAGIPFTGGDGVESDRFPAACDRMSGQCALLRAPGGQTPSQVDLFVFDGRATGPVVPRQLSENASPYGPPDFGRPGFVRGTLIWSNTLGEVLAWRPGWTEPHRLAPSGASCVVSPAGRHAACYSTRRLDGEQGEVFDLLGGALVDGGSELPVLQALYRDFNDNFNEMPAFSEDETWLALQARLVTAGTPTILLRNLSTGSQVSVLAETALDSNLQFSPDSRWLAFRRALMRGELEEEVGNLSVANVSLTPTVRDLVPGTAGFAWWRTPGGASELLLMANLVGGLGTLGKVPDVAIPQLVPLADKVAGEQVVLAPGVGRMAMIRDTNADLVPELWSLDLGSGALLQLGGGTTFSSWSEALFSPAGDKLAWSVQQGEQAALYLSHLVPGLPPALIGGGTSRLEFSSTGALLFTESPFRSGGKTSPRAGAPASSVIFGPQSTLRIHDGSSYPPRVLQPGVREHFALSGEYVLFVISGQSGSDGLYRLRLGQPPPGPASCDPLQQTGCVGGSGCFLRGPGDVTGCALAGVGGAGSECGSDTSCAPGTQCHAGQCRAICRPGVTTCPVETYCQLAPGNAALGLCLTGSPSSCDPVGQLGCGAEQACSGDPGTPGIPPACRSIGSVPLDSPCSYAGECGAGLGCYDGPDGRLCRVHCYLGSPSCPAEAPFCSYLFQSYGYCIPNPPPPPADGGTQPTPDGGGL